MNLPTTRKVLTAWFTAAVCLMQASCVSQASYPSQPATASLTAVSQATNTSTPPDLTGLVPTSTAFPALTSAMPNLVKASPTAEPEATTPGIVWTPYPIATVSASDAAKIVDFLAEKPGCRLPCWNGITPGVSSSRDGQAFFARLGIDIQQQPIDANGDYSAEFVAYSNDPPTIGIAWSNDVVSLVRVYWGYFPKFMAVPRIATALGTPNQILVANLMDTFAVLLNYSDRQTAVFILGGPTLLRTAKGDQLEVCLGKAESLRSEVDFYRPGAQHDIQRRWAEYWDDWSKALDVPTERIFQLLQDPNTCIPYD